MPSQPQLDELWFALKDRLRSHIPDDVFRVWLEPLEPLTITDGTLYIQVPAQVRDWVRRRFGSVLTTAVTTIDSSITAVEILADNDPALRSKDDMRSKRPRLNPACSFAEFVIGASNRFAHAAALAVAELPGQAYNPLFLHGPPGVGKTHLLHAIGNYTLLNGAGLAVHYATGETFMGDFTGALRTNNIHDFKRRYREADQILLDDVQFVEHKQRTAEELFHTLDELVGAGAQVVVAADRPPSAMPSLEARLRDRLQSGLVVDIATPDLATRLSIVRKRAGRLASDREELAALESIAERVSSSVAALEGALIRVRAYASLTQQPLTKSLVEQVLASLYGNTSAQQVAPTTVKQIQKLTSASLELSSDDLASPKRNRQVVYARQVAMYLCRELTSLSLPAIGQSFGGRDHTTVLHAHRQIRSRIMTDAHTRQLVDNLSQKLRSNNQDEALD